MEVQTPIETKQVADRLEEFIASKQMNKNAFARETGISPAQLFYMLSRKKNFGIDKLLKIFDAFPDLNPSWVLQGKGPMELKHNGNGSLTRVQSAEVNGSKKGTPLFNIEATAGGVEIFEDQENVEGHIKIPGVSGCDAALRVYGESMMPVIKPGDIIMVREVRDFQQINWGDVFLTITDEMRAIKRLRPGKTENEVILVSDNPEYDPVPLSRDKILRLFTAKIVIRNLTL